MDEKRAGFVHCYFVLWETSTINTDECLLNLLKIEILRVHKYTRGVVLSFTTVFVCCRYSWKGIRKLTIFSFPEIDMCSSAALRL